MPSFYSCRYFIYITFIALLTCIACKKENQIVNEDKPIQVESLSPDHASKENVILAGRILNFNNEKIIDHGFILESNFFINNTKDSISLGNNPKIGKITYKLIPNIQLLQNGFGHYKLYVKTNKKVYYSQQIQFQFTNIIFHGDEILATANEEIQIKGNFEYFDPKNYKLYCDYNNPQELSYKVDNNQGILSFNIPNGYHHGNVLHFLLKHNSNTIKNDIMVARIKIIGTLEPLSQYEYFYNDYLDFRGTGLPTDMGSSFYLIIGDKKIQYYNRPVLRDLIYDNIQESFNIGYYNGRETVMFPNKIKLKVPKSEDLKIKQTHVHPGGRIRAEGIDLGKYSFFNNVTVGNIRALYTSTWNQKDYITIGNVRDGSYPLIMEDGFRRFVSKEHINVQQVAPTSLNITKGYYGEHITMYGNFLEGTNYTLKIGDIQLGTSSSNGSIVFNIPSLKSGIYNNISVSYNYDNDKKFEIPTSLNIEILPPTFDDFYPKKIKAGESVTIKGKGIGTGLVFLGNLLLMSSGDDPNEVSIWIPHTINLKGKVNISVKYANDWIQHDEPLEII